MADEEILRRIEQLVDEEHDLRSVGDAPDAVRLAHVEETLDQCWDLLRQRRARRQYGQDPADTAVRDTSTVERYQQ
jgi:hypothetical protein